LVFCVSARQLHGIGPAALCAGALKGAKATFPYKIHLRGKLRWEDAPRAAAPVVAEPRKGYGCSRAKPGRKT